MEMKIRKLRNLFALMCALFLVSGFVSAIPSVQAGSEKVVPEVNFSQAHTKVHGREREIDQAQVKHRGKTVALNAIVVFLEFITNQRGSELSAKVTADRKGGGGPDHGPPRHRQSPNRHRKGLRPMRLTQYRVRTGILPRHRSP